MNMSRTSSCSVSQLQPRLKAQVPQKQINGMLNHFYPNIKLIRVTSQPNWDFCFAEVNFT